MEVLARAVCIPNDKIAVGKEWIIVTDTGRTDITPLVHHSIGDCQSDVSLGKASCRFRR